MIAWLSLVSSADLPPSRPSTYHRLPQRARGVERRLQRQLGQVEQLTLPGAGQAILLKVDVEVELGFTTQRGDLRRVGTAVAGLGDGLRSGESAARELEFRTDDLAGTFGSAGAQSVRSKAMPLHAKQRPVSRACLPSHDLSDENLPRVWRPCERRAEK